MSSFIMRNESVAALASMLDRSVNAAHWAGSVRYGLYNSNELYALLKEEYEVLSGRPCVDLDACKVYNVLRRTNEQATGERYRNVTPYELQEMPRGEWLKMADAAPWQLLKTFECYLYQCNEGSVSDSALYKALRQSCHYYTKHLINTRVTEYKDAEWC